MKPPSSYGLPMVFPWFSLWFSYGPRSSCCPGADAATHWDHIQPPPLRASATQQGHRPAPDVAFLRGVDAAVERHQIWKLQPAAGGPHEYFTWEQNVYGEYVIDMVHGTTTYIYIYLHDIQESTWAQWIWWIRQIQQMNMHQHWGVMQQTWGFNQQPFLRGTPWELEPHGNLLLKMQ